MKKTQTLFDVAVNNASPFKFIIEIDGDYHLSEEQQEKDIKRDLFFKYKGYTTLRLSNRFVTEKSEEYLMTYLEQEIKGQLQPLQTAHPEGTLQTSQ